MADERRKPPRPAPYPWSLMPGAWISSDFEGHGRHAVDIAVALHSPVPAPVTGLVLATSWLGPVDPTNPASLGYSVVMYDASSNETWMMGHGDGKYHAAKGDTVARGAPVMDSGNSGHSFGPHVHIERWEGRGFPKGKFLDPLAPGADGATPPSLGSVS